MNLASRTAARAVRISRCRICASEAVRPVLDLGELVSCGVFPRIGEKDASPLPLELMQCDDCALVQLAHDFPQDDLFRHTYGYRSGLNEAMVRHLGGLVDEVSSRIALKAGDVILDIGSNDGTTLGRYETSGLVRIGIDPTIEMFKKYYQSGILTVADFFTAANFERALPGKKVKIVTSIAMFYDLPDPNAFARDIAAVLADDGIWVFEQSYLPTMIDTRSFDTICHEHLEYYGLAQIKRIVEGNGMKLVDVQLNDANGGSFRVTACPAGALHKVNSAAIDALIERERREGYGGTAPIERLKVDIAEVKDQVMSFLTGAKRDGKLVHGYGASTKGNTLLQLFGVTADLLPMIADRNPTKFGCRTPGTLIPIVSEADSRALKPDFYFVLPWHFREGFIVRENEFLSRGGGLVFPLPRFDIVTAPR